ncbi:TetR/AcrR family transcriptional regulator [Agromyces neolithicus]|uniref:TetR/AcrR family transcriptional regulator n=2 Tax=Agromyces neolithicus TaxID=269420 RepID=A0ABP4YDU4_9MICO
MTDVDAGSGLWHGTALSTRDEARRRRLLDAALELYGTIGYRSTTVQAVCKRATVSTRSFYELYSEQEELLAELYGELNAEVLAGFSDVRVDPTTGLIDSVRHIVAASLGPMLRDERKARVLEVESVGISESFELRRRGAYRTFASAIDAAFGAFAGPGLIRAAPDDLSSLILVGGITEVLMQRVQTEPSRREASEAFIDAITSVILRVMGETD